MCRRCLSDCCVSMCSLQLNCGERGVGKDKLIVRCCGLLLGCFSDLTVVVSCW